MKSGSGEKRLGRPLKGDERRVRASFTLSPRQLGWLQEEAARQGLSRSDLLDRFLTYFQAQKEIPGTVTLKVAIPHKEIVAFCRQHQVASLKLFGSALRRDFGPQSDIDILVEFQEGVKLTLFKMATLEEELSQIFGGRKVDLKTVRELSPYFRDDVLEQAKVLYAA